MELIEHHFKQWQQVKPNNKDTYERMILEDIRNITFYTEQLKIKQVTDANEIEVLKKTIELLRKRLVETIEENEKLREQVLKLTLHNL